MSQLRKASKRYIGSGNDIYSSSFTPRRLNHKSKSRNEQGVEQKKTKRFIYLVLSLAFLGCLAIVLRVFSTADGLLFTKKSEVVKSSGIAPRQVVGPIIEENDGDQMKEDQHFFVSNVNQLIVELRAVRGESILFLGKNRGKQIVLRQGEKEVIKGDVVWFRLGKPSNVDVLINSTLVTTRAQDKEKSYSFTKKTM